MEPKLRLTDPVHRDDPIPFPGRDATPTRRWQPRLAKQSDDPVIRGVEDTLKQMEAKLKELGRMVDEDGDDDDRPRAA